MSVVWEEPPSIPDGHHGPGRPPAPCWSELRSRPGEWGRTTLSAKSVHVLRRRRPDFQITVRTVDGERYVYARYIGEDGVA
jgi:hypothetical protein